MTVMIGSARGDENAAAHGGKAGDQNGREVSMQEWYRHSKGWRTFRAKDPAVAARIAKEMRAACENENIGYDQYQRNALYDVARRVDFDLSRVKTACETDCSALVRVCCAAAGVMLPENVYTGNLASALLATGAFEELIGEKYNAQPDFLAAGDIQVTKTKGHTIVVLNGVELKRGMKNSETVKELQQRLIALGYAIEADGDFGENTEAALTDFQTKCGLTANGVYTAETAAALESPAVLKRGMKDGEEVRKLQENLISLGYSVGDDGADGDFGANTEAALKRFQAQHGLRADGICDEKTAAAMREALAGSGRFAVITGSTVHVRSGPGTEYESLGIVRKGEKLPAPDADGWIPVLYEGVPGYVSRKYAEVS